MNATTSRDTPLLPLPSLTLRPRLTMQVEEVGPMEIKILELQKSISDSADSCMQMEQHWLRQQSELVRKTREADQQGRAVEKLSRELLILGQKRLRLDGEGSGGRGSGGRVQRMVTCKLWSIISNLCYAS